MEQNPRRLTRPSAAQATAAGHRAAGVRQLARWLALALLLANGVQGWAADSGAITPADPFSVSAQAYLVEVNGQPRWQRHADQPLSPASLTKLMTALLVLEHGEPDRVVTVGAAAATQSGTRVGLRAGERYRIRDLLAAMLVGSANDACHALAEELAAPSSIDAFVKHMNRRAAALGLSATRFRNPCGFDARGQLSTARELAVIARAALRHTEFARIVALARVEIRPVDGQRVLPIQSTNALLGNYAPAVGIKTGYTTGAGPCLIVLGRQDGTEVLLVMLNARRRWWDAVGMLEHAFVAARDTKSRNADGR